MTLGHSSAGEQEWKIHDQGSFWSPHFLCSQWSPATELPPALGQGCTLVPLPTDMGSKQAGQESLPDPEPELFSIPAPMSPLEAEDGHKSTSQQHNGAPKLWKVLELPVEPVGIARLGHEDTE